MLPGTGNSCANDHKVPFLLLYSSWVSGKASITSNLTPMVSHPKNGHVYNGTLAGYLECYPVSALTLGVHTC